MIFEKKKKLLNIIIFLFSVQLLSEKFLILNRNELDMIKMYIGVQAKYPLLLYDFNET
jgi:hypothetical protein